VVAEEFHSAFLRSIQPRVCSSFNRFDLTFNIGRDPWTFDIAMYQKHNEHDRGDGAATGKDKETFARRRAVSAFLGHFLPSAKRFPSRVFSVSKVSRSPFRRSC
jgi:hypothetical protein